MARTSQMSRRQFLRRQPAKPAYADKAFSQSGPASPHFQQHIRRSGIPQISTTFWAFRLHGQLARQGLYSIDDLQRGFSLTSITTAMTCAGISTSPDLIGQAEWSGVLLRDVLALSEPLVGNGYANFYSRDGYSTSLPVSSLHHAVLAYQMNGESLPVEHGYPLRLIIPGVYGYKMPKWLDRVEITETPVQGFWEARGWPVDGRMSVHCVFFTPQANEHLVTNQAIALSGVAFAGIQTVTAVELNVNHSGWMPASIRPAETFAWTPWYAEWTPPEAGRYTLSVRAWSDDMDQAPQVQHMIVLTVAD